MTTNQDPPCERLEREWLDDPTQAAAVEHLAVCAACRATAARYQQVGELIEGAGETRAMPDGWEDRLLEQLDAARPQRPHQVAPAALVTAGAALHLRIIDGIWTTRPLPTAGSLTIGHGEEVDVRAGGCEVSRLHARLEVTDTGALRVVDLGSTSGTQVGRKLIRNVGVTVRLGELVLIGRTGFTVLASPSMVVPIEVPQQPFHQDLALVKGQQPDLQPGLGLANVHAQVANAAPTQSSVLLLGEAGVGKNIVAERIHQMSTRAAGPLVRLNCAGLSAAVLESELFGHERGAFTGADQIQVGLLEAAAGGTVFLDEVGELPMEVQDKLLLAIERRVTRRVGATRRKPIDVRFICSTRRDLEAEIRRGQFRADLYDCINGITIRIPPLRERRDEIDGLIQKFARDHAVMRLYRFRGRRVPVLDDDARMWLYHHDWPGNIRELRIVVESAVRHALGDLVTLKDLRLAVWLERDAIDDEVLTYMDHHEALRNLKDHEALRNEALRNRKDRVALRNLKTAGLPAGAPPSAAGGFTEDPERDRVIAVLAACGGNQSRAAHVLGISRNTLITRIRQYGIARLHGQDDPQ